MSLVTTTSRNMKRKERNMPFVSVDIEASGPIPGVYDMLSFGAVRIARAGRRYVPTADEIYLEIKPTYGGVQTSAMEVHGLDIEKVMRDGVTIGDAAKQIEAWVDAHATTEDPPVFVGYCANFDWSFVNDMFLRHHHKNPFGYKALDIRALAMGVLGMPWLELTQEKILPALGLKPLDEALAHNALEDARHQAGMLCALLDRLEPPKADVSS